MGVPYSIKVKEDGEEYFQIRLVDERKKTNNDYNIVNVGFGISQILPILVHCLTSDNSILSIMEPESHFHPSLQAELGELLADSVKEKNNQIIVETHSEHIILRILKLNRTKNI